MDVKLFLDNLMAQLDGAFAENTLKAYRSDFKHFANWAITNGLEPLPPKAEDLATYITDMSEFQKSATIRRRIDTLGSICFFAGFHSPTKTPEVKIALKRMHRKIGRQQKQAHPLTLDLLEQLLKKCDSSLAGRRNELLLRIGYETMRRSSEICSFCFEDLKTLPNGHFALNLKRSKTDQLGDGKLIPISDLLGTKITKWKRRIGATEGRILRSIRKDNKTLGDKLNPASINIILVDLQYRARRRDLPHLSGHSFRVGAALDMLNAGVPLEKIMLRGGWRKETTTLRYLQSWVDNVNPAELQIEECTPVWEVTAFN
jgi:integrase